MKNRACSYHILGFRISIGLLLTEKDMPGWLVYDGLGVFSSVVTGVVDFPKPIVS